MSSSYYAEKEVEFVHQDADGNSVKVTGIVKDQYEVHYVASLNGRISIVKLAQMQGKICKSSADITNFWKLIDMLNSHNELHINTTELAQKWGVDRSNLAKFIGRMVSEELLIKHKAGQYMCNPYVIGAKQASPKILEQLQMDWKILMIEKLTINEQLEVMMKYASLDLDVRLLPTNGKTYDFIQGLLKGFNEHQKLTPQQLRKLTSTISKLKKLFDESRYRDTITIPSQSYPNLPFTFAH